MKRNEGFTLIELMIVVAIIAIIAAIAIPSLLNARKAGNEASAISSLRTLTTVNEQYRTRFQEYPSLLTDLSAEGYIDSVLAAGQKSGYTFTYAVGANPTAEWTCTADPVNVTVTGDRYFFVDQSGVIRFDPLAAATVASNPIDG
jgi:prepilin-type N-terminal cleavage/methylation domain-containing protein